MTPRPLLWDIFCQVIDNYGDIGVCWRLATGLAARGQRVRLWVDDASALAWMAPQGCTGVEVKAWSQPLALEGLEPCDRLIESFGCTVPPEFLAHHASTVPSRAPVWINLEYLSAEPYVERCHAMPSPVLSGPAAGWTKWFFYPGFTPGTGGLLREPDLASRQTAFERKHWLKNQGIVDDQALCIALFCYEPPPLAALLDQLQHATHAVNVLVTSGRATAAMQAQHLPSGTPLSAIYLPRLSQHDFDHLLWSCDLNFVRGEDSLVRALWAGAPLVWHIYPQDDDAHHTKLEAFLDWLHAPVSLRQFHRVWNGVEAGPLPPLDLPAWRHTIRTARSRLLQQDDLATQLLQFCSEKAI